MALFSKLLGSNKEPAEESDVKREHNRFEADAERITVLSTEDVYELVDFSLGGFCLKDYEGDLRGNQYFDFKFVGVKDGEPTEVEGVATVVRVKKNQLAAKFPPQPKLRTFFKDYMN